MPDTYGATRNERLVEALVDLALAVSYNPPVATIVDLLFAKLTGVLQVPTLGVSLGPVAALQTGPMTAGSNALALNLERSQAAAADGPGAVAWITNTGVHITDVKTEKRFPHSRRRWLAANVRAVSSFPLRHGETRLGAVTLYLLRPGDLSQGDKAAAQLLADVVSGYLINTYHRIELQEQSDRTRHQALHDPLTGLPNRTLMLERLQHACERSRRSGRATAVLYVDIDGFKAVNDSYGHAVGDQLLVAIATRLTSILRPPDTLARLHGDEFVLLCEELTDPSQAMQICQRLQTALNEPLAVGTMQLTVRASVGVVITDTHTEPKMVLNDADNAMYEAKQRGGNQFWAHNEPAPERVVNSQAPATMIELHRS